MIKYETIIIKNDDEVCYIVWSPDEVDEELIERGYLKKETLYFKKKPWSVLGEMGYELKAIDSRLSLYYYQKVISIV